MGRAGGARISWPVRTGSEAQQLRKVFLFTSAHLKLTATCFPADRSPAYRCVDGTPGVGGAAEQAGQVLCSPGSSPAPVTAYLRYRRPTFLYPNKKPLSPENKTNVPRMKPRAWLNYPSIRGAESGCNLRLIANENPLEQRRGYPIILNPRAATARPPRSPRKCGLIFLGGGREARGLQSISD